MGKPLLIYSLGNLLNWSFEDDADEADPSNWDITDSNNGLNDVDDAEFHSAGQGLPSVQSPRQNVSSGVVGYKAIAAQRVQMDSLLQILKDTGQEIAVAVMVKYGDPNAQHNTYLDLKQYQGTNLTVGEGTEKSAPTLRSFVLGEGPEWLMAVTAATLHDDTNRIEVHLRYEIDDVTYYGASSHSWWDRAFVGGLLDFHKGMKTFSLKPEAGYVTNVGDGVAEIVKLTSSMTEMSMALNNILEGGPYDLGVKALLRTLASNEPGMVALWGDRDRFLNGQRHFQRVILKNDTPRITYPEGVTRRSYKFSAMAFSEFTD
jgi:hypothetical protein